ncbi:hypothetical protein AB0C74_40320, partial [Spirillospora sp. NPDC048832]
ALGLPNDPHQPHTVTDQLDGTTYTWTKSNYVRLDPHTKPAHILTFDRNDGHVRASGARADGSMAGADGTTARSRGASPRPASRAARSRRQTGGS